MSRGELTPAELRAQHEAAISKASTFSPRGVSADQALDFLDTDEGKRYIAQLRAVNPQASDLRLAELAVDQIRTGIELPTARTIEEPLYKLVPSGNELSTRSPFFTTGPQIEDVRRSGQSVIERFGLPITSEAERYDIYQMRPKGAAEVFSSTVAPTPYGRAGGCCEAQRRGRAISRPIARTVSRA